MPTPHRLQIALFGAALRAAQVRFERNAKWTADDLSLVNVALGDPVGQARLEAYALLVSMWCWREIVATSDGGLAIVGDALGVVRDPLKLRSNDAVLNKIKGEFALVLAPVEKSLTRAHIWSERNTICDQLSRMTADFALPELLSTIKRTQRRPPEFRALNQHS